MSLDGYQISRCHPHEEQPRCRAFTDVPRILDHLGAHESLPLADDERREALHDLPESGGVQPLGHRIGGGLVIVADGGGHVVEGRELMGDGPQHVL